MRRSLLVRTLLPAVIMVSAVLSGTAFARPAEITPVDFTEVIDVVLPADCFDGTMHVTGTERIVGQIVDLGDENSRFHGTLTDDLDVAFSNGMTGAWTTDEHFSLIFRVDDEVQTNVHRDTTAVYDSSGEFVGEVSFRVVEHVTVVDGIARVEFAHATLTCDI